MRLFITGATGFVGRHVVAAAIERGHTVRAVLRPSSSGSTLGTLLDHPGLEPARVDLRSSAGLSDALDGVESVVHLAAAKAGDFYTQFAGTVVATENLLAAMTETATRQLVAVSTFSVYDYLAMGSGTLLDEQAPIDQQPARRDEYARTKLIQEELYRGFASSADSSPDKSVDNRTVIIRPGMIYGRNELWHALLGAELGPLFLRIGSKAILPMIYVENCAEALVLAAEQLAADPSPVDGETINLVDDDLPTQQAYVDAVTAHIDPPRSVTVPWPIMKTAADLLERGNQRLAGGRAKFPGFVVPDRLHGRFKPLRYTNAKAKRLLGWEPRYKMAEAFERSTGDSEVLAGHADG